MAIMAMMVMMAMMAMMNTEDFQTYGSFKCLFNVLIQAANVTSPSKMEERRKPLFGLTG